MYFQDLQQEDIIQNKGMLHILDEASQDRT